MPPPDSLFLLMVLAVAAFASFTQGFSGFGFGILMMAGLSFFVPDAERASVVITIAGVAAMLTIICGEREGGRVDWRAVGLLMTGIVIGLPLGYLFILKLGERPVFPLVLGVVLIGFAGYGLLRPKVARLRAGWGPPLGVLSGFITGAFTSGGPPLVVFLYGREPDPRMAKRSLQTVFLLAASARLVAIGGGAGYDAPTLAWAAGVVPLVIVVTWLGTRLSQKVSARLFTRIVYGLIGFGGVLNVLRGAAGYL